MKIIFYAKRKRIGAMYMFKPTGIIRRIDDIGRIVIPKAIREQLGIEEGAPLEVCVIQDPDTGERTPYLL